MYKELGIYCVMILCAVFYRNAIADNAQEYAVRAGIVTNLARFTTWPENQSNSINLCFIGNPAIEDAFTSLNGKAIGNKTLQVRYLPRFNDLTACQLLYISDLENNKLIFLLNEIKLLPETFARHHYTKPMYYDKLDLLFNGLCVFLCLFLIFTLITVPAKVTFLTKSIT